MPRSAVRCRRRPIGTAWSGRRLRPMTAGAKCLAKRTRNGGALCQRPAGWGTDHPGIGSCKMHGGSTPGAEKHAKGILARMALEKLAIPITGDPIVVLEAAIASAFGFLRGARELLADSGDEAMAKLYAESIERAARTAKFGVDAKLDEARLELDRERALMIVVIFRAGLDAFERSGSREEAERALIAELRATVPAGTDLN